MSRSLASSVFCFPFIASLPLLFVCDCSALLFSAVFLFALLSEPFVALCRVGVRRRSRCCQFSAGLVKAQPDTQSSRREV
jgi:hypothetical protein